MNAHDGERRRAGKKLLGRASQMEWALVETMPRSDPKEPPPRNHAEQLLRMEKGNAEREAWGSSPRVVEWELEYLELKARALDLLDLPGIADLYRKDADDVRHHGQVLLPWFD
jgi:hypothetical protein